MKPSAAFAALLACLLLTACAGTTVGLRSGNAPLRAGAPAPGTSYSSSAIRAEVNANAYFGLLFVGAFAAGVGDDYLSWRYGPDGRKPPPLAADRAIAERDCSQPLPAPSANLRCK